MNAGPYSDERVQKFLEDHFIPLKIQCFFDHPDELMKRFNVTWTPTLVVLDPDGREHHRMVGYVPVDDLLAHLGLGRGKVLFDTKHLVNAIQAFKTVVELHPCAGAAPEAIFYRGVAEYKRGHDAAALRWIHDTLKGKYPESEWTRRSEPYAQIPAHAEV